MKEGVAINKVEQLGRWTKEKSEELYGINSWGQRYVSVSDEGEVIVNPFRNQPKACTNIREIVEGIKDRGLDMPDVLEMPYRLQISGAGELGVKSMITVWVD